MKYRCPIAPHRDTWHYAIGRDQEGHYHLIECICLGVPRHLGSPSPPAEEPNDYGYTQGDLAYSESPDDIRRALANMLNDALKYREIVELPEPPGDPRPIEVAEQIRDATVGLLSTHPTFSSLEAPALLAWVQEHMNTQALLEIIG